MLPIYTRAGRELTRSTANPALIAMNEDKSVTAVFIQTVTLTIGVQPQGSGTVSPSGSAYDSGAQVSLTATPASGWRFDHWEGHELEGSTANPASITINANKSVTAVFIQQFTLTMSVQGSGTSSPQVGTHTYDAGTPVTVIATPDAGWLFDRRQGHELEGSTANPASLIMDSNKSVTAVMIAFSGHVLDITFISDHGVLYNGSANFKDTGILCDEPEWASSGINWPITQTMSGTTPSVISARVTLEITPSPGRPFQIESVGSSGYLNFCGTSDGFMLVVAVASNIPLPSRIDRIAETIHWTLTFTDAQGGQIDLGSTGPHKVFVTYGIPTCSGSDNPGWQEEEVPTIKRLDFLVEAGMNASGNPLRKPVAHEIAKAIEGKLTSLGPVPTAFLWEILDTQIFECESARRLAAVGMMMLGVNKAHLRWTPETGCHAWASTDNTTGLGYYSDCTNRECPPRMCSNSSCTIPPAPEPHPDHDTTMLGSTCDGPDCGSNDWQLRFASDSPAENFFKVQAEDGDWFYISVVPANGPYIGSDTPGDDLDLHGRYKILDETRDGMGGGYWQYWFWRNPSTGQVFRYTAPNLPNQPN